VVLASHQFDRASLHCQRQSRKFFTDSKSQFGNLPYRIGIM
jgi:hypothetical protein